MNSKLLFLLGCIPVRILLVYISTQIPQDKLKYFGILLLLISISFLFLYFTNGRMNAPEAGGVTWWSNLRIMHGLFYLAAAVYAFQGKPQVWIPLLIDVIFGIFAFALKEV
jgi:hypothetical protein